MISPKDGRYLNLTREKRKMAHKLEIQLRSPSPMQDKCAAIRIRSHALFMKDEVDNCSSHVNAIHWVQTLY